MSRRRLFALPLLLLLALAILLWPVPAVAEPVTRRITLRADQFAYTPAVLRVNRGDRVILTLQAGDVVHGFFLDGYGINVRVDPGRSQTVEFVADRSGKFRYRCPVSCGPLHPFMIGELVVGPNLPFLRAAGLLAVTVAGTLTFLSFPQNKEKR
ncbi:MAG: hypothetical protein D6796_15130 [Caldilineae bacterium]|nr:MAG: hypothetical protein D6796_15130 [Caldilineae bacterium]